MAEDTALGPGDVEGDPIDLARRWLDEACRLGLPEPTAMTLATVAPDGAPRARMVLCKGIDADGVRFATNFDSDKGRELAACPRAALVFWWHGLHRQLRIEGGVVRAPAAESDAVFDARPRGSRIAAIASRQSRPLPDRAALERRVAEIERELGDADPRRPAEWGVYRLLPERLEFWQARRHRLHDRFRLERDGSGRWRAARLAP